ncbi:MAG: cytochrome c1, partial [Acidiferrobacter sp.]
GGIYTKNGTLLVPGRESPAVFDRHVADVVAFLRYASDPSIFERRAIGRYVIGAFLILAILAYFLKKDYWRGIHEKRADDAVGKAKSGKPVTKS